MAGRGVAAEDDDAARVLRAAGVVVTAPRLAVYRALAGRERPASAGEVFDVVRAGGSRVALVSVYRALGVFAAVGMVHVFGGEEARYRVCRPGPHAHLICQQCGLVIECPAEVVRAWLAPAAGYADFEPSDVYGRCGTCRRGGASSAVIDGRR